MVNGYLGDGKNCCTEDRLGRLRGGDVEISKGISEQTVRKLKMNLRNVGNIGSESSSADNAFMYSVIESCRLNDPDSGTNLQHLLNRLKSHRNSDNLNGLEKWTLTLIMEVINVIAKFISQSV